MKRRPSYPNRPFQCLPKRIGVTKPDVPEPKKEQDKPSVSFKRKKKSKKRVEKPVEKVFTEEEQKPPPVEEYSFKRALKKTFADYCNETSVQGVPYLHPKNSLQTRVFWGLFVLISFVVCINQLKSQYIRWKINPTIISFAEAPTPVSQIPFPAVTICSEVKNLRTERLNFTRFYHYLRTFGNEIIEQPSWLTDDEFIKMRALLQVCGNHVVENMTFPEYPPIVVTDHLNMMAPPFETQFVFCAFNQSLGSCVPFFEKIYTEEGICYTFNALNESEFYRSNTHQYKYFEKDKHVRIRNESLAWDMVTGYRQGGDTYPERSIGSGLRAGFQVSMNEQEKHLDYTCRGPVEGFKVVLHSPDDIPQIDKSYIHVPHDRDVLVLVTPQFVYTTEEVDAYAPKRRNCYFPQERYLQFFQFYTQTNCEMECLANFTLRACGCVQFSMPRLPDTPVCDASKILCYDQAENDFLLSEYTGMGHENSRCKCLPACYMLRYTHEVSQGFFNTRSILEDFDVDSLLGNLSDAKISRLRVFFKNNEFTARKRAKMYGLNDFLASIGGLLGLFIGISALSIIQLFYYFTDRLHRNAKDMKPNQINSSQ